MCDASSEASHFYEKPCPLSTTLSTQDRPWDPSPLRQAQHPTFHTPFWSNFMVASGSLFPVSVTQLQIHHHGLFDLVSYSENEDILGPEAIFFSSSWDPQMLHSSLLRCLGVEGAVLTCTVVAPSPNLLGAESIRLFAVFSGRP